MSAGEVGLVWCAVESETTRTEVRCLVHNGENEVASFSGHLAAGVRGEGSGLEAVTVTEVWFGIGWMRWDI